MTHVYVEYTNARELVDNFKTLRLVEDAVFPNSHRTANFVMIQEKLYFGTYGGLLYTDIVNKYRFHIHETHSLCDSIGCDLSIVWWNTFNPPVMGDVYSLANHGRVAVTPKMFQSIKINTIQQKKPSGSSYISKACCINNTSSSNSDSE